jgi:S-adenosylmethionine hydrolase
MYMPALITLTTDFGLADPYVAEMKGVILSISPHSSIVDISHDIEKFNVRMAAYTLASAAPYFSEGTVHVAVVDPGVGMKRRVILIQTQQAFYIGPDNGVLVLAARSQGIEHVFKITNPRFKLPVVSNTFHGRDIFAPVAAHLSKGVQPAEFGPEIQRISRAPFARIVRGKNMLIGEVLHTDGFGNVITNFPRDELQSTGAKSRIDVKLKSRKMTLKLCKSYAEVNKKEALAMVGSHGFLEISVNQGDAAASLKVKVGDKITLFRA